jgi:hypothetical protein
VLLAAARKRDDRISSLILSQSGFVGGLLHVLPGGAQPLKAAQDLAATVAASVTISQAGQLTVDLTKTLTDTQLSLACSIADAEQGYSEAAEQAAWVLTSLTSARSTGGHEQLPNAMAPLLVTADSDMNLKLGMLRGAVASRLGKVAGETFGSRPPVQEAAANALSMLVQSVSAEERLQMASCTHVVCGLTQYLEWFNRHGCGYTTNYAIGWGLGAEAAAAALLKLAADSKLQLAALVAPAGMQASSEASLQTWLTANSGVLQQAAAAGWGCVSIAQMAAIAREARQKQAQQRQRQQQHPGVCSKQQQSNVQERHSNRKQRDQQQQATGDRAVVAAGCVGAGASGDHEQGRQHTTSRKAPAPSSPQPRKKQATEDKARPSSQPDGPNAGSRAGQINGAAVAAASSLEGLREVGEMAAGQAGSCSRAADSSCAALHALDRAQQEIIQRACGSIPSDEQLPAWQVAVQPFDSQQLQDLCATYLPCNFAFGEAWEPAVRSQELVPLLRQLHSQAKAQQLKLPAPKAGPAAAAAPTVQPTPAAVKLLRALRLLQHWDIVCPTQPGMPEPLVKMMQQAGYAAAGSAADDGDDDDLQVVDAGPAAEVADDVDAQLQQLEDGECELVLVKYVPGRHEQPGIQLVDQRC